MWRYLPSEEKFPEKTEARLSQKVKDFWAIPLRILWDVDPGYALKEWDESDIRKIFVSLMADGKFSLIGAEEEKVAEVLKEQNSKT